MSQAEQHELPAGEGGRRLNWLLAVLVLIVAIVMGIVLAAGVQSSGVSSQSSASSDPGDASETANKGAVADLLSHGGKVPDAAPALPLPHFPRIPSGFRTVSARCARCRAVHPDPPHQAADSHFRARCRSHFPAPLRASPLARRGRNSDHAARFRNA